MLIEGHIFTIKTKDPHNVADIKNVSTDVVISGLNVLKDQITAGDLVFVVFGGDKPPWKTGLVGLAKISRAPFDEGYDGKKNFRVGIDIVSFFEHITRGDLVSYPDTFDTIGIAPITKWEPNQAITSVPKEKAIALLQAACELRPNIKKDVEKLLGPEFAQLTVPVKRYIETLKPFCGIVNLREEFRAWLTNVYRKKDGSALGDTSSYVNCLSYLTDASQHLGKYDERSTSYWYNMYHFLYGEDGASVFECLTRKDVEERFKGVIAAVIDGDAPDGVDIAHFNIVREWSNEPQVKKGSWVKCSFARYFEFLEWREAQKKPEDKKDELPPNVDRLSVALKLFAEKRKDDGEGGWFDTGFDVNANIRGYFDALTVDVLKGFGEEKITELFCGLKGSDGKTFEPMWSGKPGQGWGNIKPNDPEAVQKIVDFLVELKTDAGISSRFLQKGFKHPKGFGSSVITELLMKFHPGSCVKHGERSHDALAWLGFIDFPWSSDYSETDYKVVCGAAAKILQKMQSMKIPRLVNADGSVDNSPPDYLTVNEFIYFVNTNQDLIKEKVMGATYKKTEIKKSATPKRIDDFSAFIKKLEDDVASAGLKYAPNLMKRFVCALLAKPFVVLTGLSGSGKTKLAQAFAEWIAVKNTSLVVPVGADWTNSERLLGYPNALESGKYVLPETRVLEFILDASENKDVPFFLVLDEMNLSHVERYFADFLSAMESGDEIKLYSGEKRHASNGREIPQTLAFPKNLFVIGTMNVDETTYMFSPKVLDRAQVIEFRVSKDEMSAFLSAPSNPTLAALAGKGAEYAEAFQRLADARKDKKPTDESLAGIKNALDGFFPPLSELGAEFGYRTAIEIVTFVAYYIEAKAEVDNAIDAAIVQKLLPKLHGSQARLGPVLKKLKELASKKTVKEENGERKEVVAPLYKLTCDKLARMQERLKANGFTSFAEA